MSHCSEVSPCEHEGGVVQALRNLLKPSKNAVALVHPEMPMLGILWIPEEYILKTAGAQKYSKGQPHIPSLCLLFQHARCNSREACNQIHVDRDFAERLRGLLQTSVISNCCRFHGDLGSSNTKLLGGAERVEMRASGMPPVMVPASRIAVTEYWAAAFSWSYLRDKQNVMFFSPTRVCNLHQREACKYGSACKNVHICREFWAQVMCPYQVPEPQSMMHYRKPGYAPHASGPHPDPAGAREVPRPPTKRQSRALPIVDPTSGEEVYVKTETQIDGDVAGDPTVDEAAVMFKDASSASYVDNAMKALVSGAPMLRVAMDPFCHEGDIATVPAPEVLSLNMDHLEVMTMNLSLENFQNMFPIPLDFDADLSSLHEDVVPKPGAEGTDVLKPVESPVNLSFNGRHPRPGSPSNSSGTDLSYGDDSGDGDDEHRHVNLMTSAALYSAFWGTPVPPPVTVGH